MIVTLDETLFAPELADDVHLIGLIAGGRIQTVLEEGLKAPQYALPEGFPEPNIVVVNRVAPAWPDDPAQMPARLPLLVALELLQRPLRLLLENGRNDWAFLEKVVPKAWKKLWGRAVEKRWLEEQNAGGITEMKQIIEQQLAGDPVRRLRTWAMCRHLLIWRRHF